jgi:hypothetical protein
MTLKEWADALKAEADGGTSALLYFVTARAYHASARSLMKKPIRRPAQREAPIRALLHHAAELYLKAFLLHSGMTPAQLRRIEIRHNYEKLVDDALKRGLVLGPKPVMSLQVLQLLGAFSRARYPFVAANQADIGLDDVNEVCNALASSIGPQVLGTKASAHPHLIEPI